MEDLLLFDFVRSDDATPSGKVLRACQLPAKYREALDKQEPRFACSTTPARKRLYRFLFPGHSPEKKSRILIEVTYKEHKPKELFTDDLLPYWQYVVENFDVAVVSREESYRQSIPSVVRDFLASTVDGVKDDAGLKQVLEAAAKCVQDTLDPFSMYIRTLDRKSNCLVKREGFGRYFALAPDERLLAFNGLGSSLAACNREAVWEERASWEEIRPCLDRDLSPSEKQDLDQIVSYVTVPIVYMDHVLGTLNIQFDDDSLFSEAKRAFVADMAGALGSALGSFKWAHQRQALVEHGRILDERMFSREEEENQILAYAARMIFELTTAEVVLYYRYDSASNVFRLVASAMHQNVSEDRSIPNEVPGNVGILGLVVATREEQFVRDYRAEDWRDIRVGLLDAFLPGPERDFCEWVLCEVAQPVLVDEGLDGVLVAVSSIPNWLNSQDVEVVREFAFKTSLCLEAKHLTRQLDWELRAKIAMNRITTAMARSSKEEELYRLFLLAVTTGECLGFSRAVLLLRRNGADQPLEATLAVGPSTGTAAEAQWRDAEESRLSEKIDRSSEEPIKPRPDDLQTNIAGLSLDISQNPEIATPFSQGEMVVRRQGESHLVSDPRWQRLLFPDGNENVEYVLAPLQAAGKPIGAVLADRSFLEHPEITDEILRLLQVLTSEFGLILAGLKQRRKEEETRIAEELARGVSYGLGSRIGLLEAGMTLLKDELGGQHPGSIARIERHIEFFKHSSALTSGLLRVGRFGVEKGERFDLNEALAELIRIFDDPNIEFRPARGTLMIRAEKSRIEDIFLEILLNARDPDFTVPGRERRIWARSAAAAGYAQVSINDNGCGIHADLRPHLFEAFQCYPRSRRGLGLAYAQAVAKAYEGSIQETSMPDEGAHFLVSIPLAEDHTT